MNSRRSASKRLPASNPMPSNAPRRCLRPGARIAYHAWSGVGQHTNATQTERAIATLYALTGASTRAARIASTSNSRPMPSARTLSCAAATCQGARPRRTSARAPAQGWITARDMYRAMLEGEPYKVRALFAFGTNPLVSQPDAESAHAALSQLEFHVHCDLYETPSSRYADIFCRSIRRGNARACASASRSTSARWNSCSCVSAW